MFFFLVNSRVMHYYCFVVTFRTRHKRCSLHKASFSHVRTQAGQNKGGCENDERCELLSQLHLGAVDSFPY